MCPTLTPRTSKSACGGSTGVICCANQRHSACTMTWLCNVTTHHIFTLGRIMHIQIAALHACSSLVMLHIRYFMSYLFLVGGTAFQASLFSSGLVQLGTPESFYYQVHPLQVWCLLFQWKGRRHSSCGLNVFFLSAWDLWNIRKPSLEFCG